MKKNMALLFSALVALVTGVSYVSAENWVEYERFTARDRAGPLHYKLVPAHYEKQGEGDDAEDVFVPADYSTIITIYNAQTETTRVYVEKDETIYLRLNKRPSIEVSYDVVTYLDKDSNKRRIEFENVEVLIN